MKVNPGQDQGQYSPMDPCAPLLPGYTPGSMGALTRGAPREQPGALREQADQQERPSDPILALVLAREAARQERGAVRARLRDRRRHGLRARHAAKLSRLDTPRGDTRDQPSMADIVGVMRETGTAVRFTGGPLAGTERAKTTTGRPSLYLTVDGLPLSPARGDRIVAAEGLERSTRAAVNACYVKVTDAFEPTGRRLITYRFITTERTTP